MAFVDTLYGRPNTIKTQRCLFERWIKPYEHLDFSKEENIISVLKVWSTQTRSHNTLKSLLSLLVRYAKTQGTTIESRRYRRLILRQNQQYEIKAFDQKTARKIIDKASPRLKTALMLAYFAGLRKGEIFGLYCEDFNFETRKVKISRSYDGPTKNGRSRYINLDKELEYHLIHLGVRTHQGPLIEAFDPNPEIKAICRRIGSWEGTIHTFRHTFATLALEAGRSVKQVQEALGHSSPSITMDLYWSNIKGDLELGFC